MPVTRIKNNQVTDASGSNVQLGINANTKLQNFSITSGKLANNLTYGSDLTITGNLTVQGNATAIDTTITTIEDPVIVLASTQTSGVPAVDIGFLGFRGAESNIAFVWDESASEFVTAFTSTGETNTTIAITSYANFHTQNANVAGNLIVGGNIDITGNITNLNVTGNISGGNLLTTGLVSATGNVTGGNVTTVGLITATGNITGGNIDTAGLVTATGNVTGGNITTAGLVTATGDITGGNILTGGNISAAGNITANPSSFFIGNGSQLTGVAASSANFPVSNGTSNINAAVNANIEVGVSGTSNVAVFAPTGLFVTGNSSTTGNVTGGNITTAGLITATGNITGGNLLTPGLISASGLATSGNIETVGYVSATGNVTGGNVISNTVTNTSGDLTIVANTNLVLAPTGNVVLDGGKYINSVLDPIQAQDAATKQYVDDAVSSGITIHTPVYVESPTPLTATYAQGGTTATVTDTVAGNTVVFSSAVNPQVNDQYWFANSFSGIVANTAYFVVSAPNTSAAVLSTTYNGTPVTNITNASALTQSVRINSGIGATLTNAGANATLVIDGVTLSTTQRVLIYTQADAAHNGVYVVSEPGNATTAWQLTRSTDTDVYGPKSTQELDVGDYFYVQAGDTGAGESYVMTAPEGPFIIGFDGLTFTQFSASQVYTANTSAGLSLTGTVFSAKVDNNTTAFDIGGNISVKAGANLTTPNIGDATGTSLSTTGNISTGGNLIASGYVTAIGNVTGGNIDTAGNVSATGNITGGNITTVGLITATGNITGGNILFGAGDVSGTGNIYANTIFANISGNIDAGGANTDIQFNDGDILSGSPGFTFNKVGNVVTANGNINGANLFTGGTVSATGNVTGGNVTTVGLITATGNITGGNIDTAGLVTATGNITGGNIDTAGQITATGNITGGNLILTGAALDTTAGRLTVNSTSADADFAVNGTTLANVFYVDAGSNTASFGSSTQVTNAIVNFDATTSIKLPVGNTTQRPATGVTGMQRFNTTTNSLEVYNNSQWQSVGATIFTVIGDEQFNGDGSTVAFTLSSTQTTNSCIVSINGVVQIPTLAYAVAGTNPTCVLTFTEAPASGDVIDVRQITTTTTVLGISNASGNASVGVTDTSSTVLVTGDLSVSGSILGGNINSTAITNGTSNMSVISSGGNIRANVGGATIVSITSTGIENGMGNGVGNIGGSSSYFNTIFAVATSAQYADLAEKYAADADYAPGTVVMFGGSAEVTVCADDACKRVAGVISTNPSYRMNDGLVSAHTAMVALTGRVPTRVTGTVRKGDMMVSAGNGTARSEANPQVGTVIGKALEDFDGAEGTIEVVVGRV